MKLISENTSIEGGDCQSKPADTTLDGEVDLSVILSEKGARPDLAYHYREAIGPTF